MIDENDVTVWRRLRLEDFTEEQHAQLAASMWQTQRFLQAEDPDTAGEKRKRTIAINYLVDLRRMLRRHFGHVYADPVLADELELDPDVWGDCIAGLDLRGLTDAI